MKALVKKSPEHGIWMEDVPEPQCGTNDVKIKITHTGICGTDLHIYTWNEWAQRTLDLPLITGHEFCGIVEEIGPGITHYKPGDHVSGEAHITCGYCRNCRAGKRHLCHKTIGVGIQRDGAFAEYLVIPESNVWPIHKDIPLEIAAFFDPYGNAAHTALSFEMVAEDVLITGAGPIGIMAVAICNGAPPLIIVSIKERGSAIASPISVVLYRSITFGLFAHVPEEYITPLDAFIRFLVYSAALKPDSSVSPLSLISNP